MRGEEEWRLASLCVVGNLNRDVEVTGIAAAARLLEDGETSATHIAEKVGGGGAHVAAAAASLGARVSFAGKVGADDLGDRLDRALTGAGVRTYLTRDPQLPSGTSIALDFDDGHRHFVSRLPTAESLAFADLDLRCLAGCAHLLRADIWFSEPMLHGGNELLLSAARERGLAVSVDLNWDPQWGAAEPSRVERRKAAVRALLPRVDLVHGNARELTVFAGAADLDEALARLCRWGAGAAVVHLGSRGAGYYRDGQWVVEGPAPVRCRRRASGTGDVLSACMVLLEQHPQVPVPERLRLANQVVAGFMEGRRALFPALG